MAQYALLVWGPSDARDHDGYDSADARDAQMRATGELNAELQAAGQLVYVNGFAAAEHGTYVDGRTGDPVTEQGPYTGGAESVNGLWVIDVESREDALALAARASQACQRVIEVRAVGG